MNEFRRMMQRVLKNNWRGQWIIVMLVLLFTGLLISRALVSFASVLMMVPFLFSYKEAQLKKPLLPALCLLLLPVIISGIWSDDKMLWWNSLSVKFPLFTMMLGLSSVQFSKQRWLQLICIYIIIITFGCCWSVWQYANNATDIQASYLKAKLLPTPADDDHLRFSWMVVTAVILGFACLTNQTSKRIRYLLLFLIFFMVMYLHLLASKTGLLCLYGGGFIYLLSVIFQKKWRTGLGIIAAIVSLAILCYTAMPTLRNRIQYVVYDFSNYSKGNIMPGYNDAARWLSIKAGYHITNEHPLTGVGFGDLLSAVDQWHRENHPESLAYERFLPANEWLVYGAGSGWPGLVCFTAGLLLLLYTTTSKNIGSFILSVISLVPFLIDDTLEGQYGVVLLAFIAFFGQQTFPEQTTNT